MRRLSFLFILSTLAACGGSGENADAAESEPNATLHASSKLSETVSAPNAAAASHVDPASEAVLQPSPHSSKRTRILRQADDDTIGWLVLDWTSEEAPIVQWAESGIRVGSNGVTEFNRAERIAAEHASIARQRDAAKGYGKIRVSLNSNLSEYDAGYGEFYVNAFSPGSSVVFRPFQYRRPNPLNRGVNITFTNADDAFVLPMQPEEAEALVGRLESGRRITVDMDLTIEEVNLGADNATIIAHIDQYSLLSTKHGASRALHTITLSE